VGHDVAMAKGIQLHSWDGFDLVNSSSKFSILILLFMG
jgi:hypothetical protein